MDTIFQSVKNVIMAVELFVYIEEKAAEFYKNQAEQAEQEEIKHLLLFLAEEEQKHHKMLLGLLEKAGGAPFKSVELVGEYGMFIDLMSSDILNGLKFDINMTTKDIIKKALQLEKDILIIYKEIKSLFKEQPSDVLDEICIEERKHILKLLECKKSLR